VRKDRFSSLFLLSRNKPRRITIVISILYMYTTTSNKPTIYNIIIYYRYIIIIIIFLWSSAMVRGTIQTDDDCTPSTVYTILKLDAQTMLDIAYGLSYRQRK